MDGMFRISAHRLRKRAAWAACTALQLITLTAHSITDAFRAYIAKTASWKATPCARRQDCQAFLDLLTLDPPCETKTQFNALNPFAVCGELRSRQWPFRYDNAWVSKNVICCVGGGVTLLCSKGIVWKRCRVLVFRHDIGSVSEYQAGAQR